MTEKVLGHEITERGAECAQALSLLEFPTVGYHLYKAYPTLGITSRNELIRMDIDL